MTRSLEQISHPAPHRGRVSVPWLLSGLAIPPAAWTVEMLVGFGISSNACPLTPNTILQARFSGEATILLVLQLVCLIAATTSGFMSWRHWLRVRLEKKDTEHAHLTLGEGRTRFVSLASILMAGTFSLAILFNLLEPIIIPLCWSLR